MNVPNGRIAVTGHESHGVTYRKLTKKEWGKLYRSCDEGQTWHRTSSEAFWTAFHSGKLTKLSANDASFITDGGMVLA
jgi:photosystem II stability/assembly factor-like uncharacterized protein